MEVLLCYGALPEMLCAGSARGAAGLMPVGKGIAPSCAKYGAAHVAC